MTLRGLLGVILASAAAVSSAATAPQHMTSRRPDGTTIDWYLDSEPSASQQGVLIVAQGSGCSSVSTNRNVEAAKALLPAFAKVTVEKYGVSPGVMQKTPEDCSKQFYAHHTVSQRAADYRAVIDDLKQAPWWNGQLVLFGGSEGGAVVQILAGEVQPDATVIFSAATGIPFGKSFVEVLPPEAAAEAPAALERARQNPQSPELWGGNSLRWLADVMDRPLWEDALKARGPILVIQGGRDQSNPVSSARAFVDVFATRRRCNLTYWEYGDYDHTMTDPSGVSHLQEVLVSVSTWLRARLAEPHASRAREQEAAGPATKRIPDRAPQGAQSWPGSHEAACL